VDTADKIGLLPGFGWVANQEWFGHSWWSQLLSTLLVCWLLTPIGHIAWAYIAQAIIVPLDSKRQWQSFFPGDLFLGAAVALLIFAARISGLETDGHWWQSPVFHGVVLASAIVVALVITVLVDGPNMPASALWSPSKLYHNFLLYGGYGYIAVTSLVAAVAGNWFGWRLVLVLVAFVAALPWLHFVGSDGKLSPAEVVEKQRFSHPASYRLFWVFPVHGEYPEPREP